MIEDRIGDYIITESLGKGGFGSVWKARSGDGAVGHAGDSPWAPAASCLFFSY